MAHECVRVRDHVGIMDHGGFTKYSVSGSGASDYIDNLFCGRLPTLGRVKLAYMLTPKGRILSEATIARLDQNEYLLCGPTLADLRDHDWMTEHLPTDGSVVLKYGNRHDATVLIMGPDSRSLLSALTDFDLSKTVMPWMSVAEIHVADCPVIAMRVSYVGELGFELHVESNYLLELYQAICDVGVKYKLANFGSYALNSMRLEKAYHGWGSDFGNEYTMYDAGLNNFVDLEKPEFIGRHALIKQSKKTADWRFVRLIIDTNVAEPLAGDPILIASECVGYVTSGGTGFRIGKCLALGYVAANVPEQICNLEVQILGIAYPARICNQAFYDPENSKLNS